MSLFQNFLLFGNQISTLTASKRVDAGVPFPCMILLATRILQFCSRDSVCIKSLLETLETTLAIMSLQVRYSDHQERVTSTPLASIVFLMLISSPCVTEMLTGLTPAHHSLYRWAVSCSWLEVSVLIVSKAIHSGSWFSPLGIGISLSLTKLNSKIEE